jgi:hypothetical protein
MWATSVPTAELCERGLKQASKPLAEGLLLLRQFCENGQSPLNGVDLVSKELLYYRIMDMFAQVNGRGMEHSARERSVVLKMVKLVSY